MNLAFIFNSVVACFTCMKSSDAALNEATSNAILAMIGVTALPMLGVIALVVKVVLQQRKVAQLNCK